MARSSGSPYDPAYGAAAETPVYVISVAAELSGLHPQTLRQYDRLGLVSPDRAPGRGRRYSARDIEMLREVQRLSQEDGVNLAGVKRILDLEDDVETLRKTVRELRAELRTALSALAAPGRSSRRPSTPGTALVVWRPRSR